MAQVHVITIGATAEDQERFRALHAMLGATQKEILSALINMDDSVIREQVAAHVARQTALKEEQKKVLEAVKRKGKKLDAAQIEQIKAIIGDVDDD
jgi:3-methyladenine DNA glycosylase AlkD